MRRAPIVGILLCLVASFVVVPVPNLSAAHCAWSVVPAPNPGGRETVFSDIDGVGDDLWAVGGYARWGESARTLAEHHTTSGWEVVPTPNLNQRNNSLTAVKYLAADDVWAVGTAETKDGSRNLLAHLTAGAWQRVSAPSTGRAYEFLNAVDAVPASAIPNPLLGRQMWAVGYTSNSRGRGGRGMVLHYDGTAWNVQILPAFDRSHYLHSVVAFSETDVWAAGRSDTSNGSKPLVMHFDGTEWSRVPTPNPGAAQGGSLLTAIAGSASSDLYAVGARSNGDSLVMHYDGVAWTAESNPARDLDSSDLLLAVDTQPSGEVWASGVTFGRTFSLKTLVHNKASDGSWSNEAVPNPSDVNFLLSVLALDEGPTWAAGFRARAGRPLRNLLVRCG